VAGLAATAGLLRVFVLALHLLRDRFAVRDLGLADVRLDLELALQAVADDVEVELAHAGDDRLAGLFVRVDAERRVLRGELLETDAELLDVGLRLRLDRDRDDGLREDHLLEEDRLLLVAERVARARVLQTDGRVDVARVGFRQLFTLVRVHTEDAADALALTARRVRDHRARRDRPRVDAEERQVAVRVVDDLERVAGE